MTLENIKNKLNKSAMEQIAMELEILETKRNNIMNSETVPSLLWSTIVFYGNTMPQGAEIVELVKTTSNSNFINSVKEPKIQTNQVLFSKGGYYVKFPKAFLKRIDVGREERMKEPVEPKANQIILKLSEYIKEYKEGNMSLYDMKRLYVSHFLKSKPNFTNVRKVKEQEFQEFFEEVQAHLNAFKNARKKWKEDMEKYNSCEKEDILFLKDVMEYLKQFENEGWTIGMVNLHEDALKFKEYL